MHIPLKSYIAFAVIGIVVAFAFVQCQADDESSDKAVKQTSNNSFKITPVAERLPGYRRSPFDGDAPICGIVRSPDHKPVPKANVWVVAFDRMPVQQIVADQEGRFETNGVYGRWLVATSPDGQLESKSDSVGIAGLQLPLPTILVTTHPNPPPFEVIVHPRDRWSLPVQVVDPKGNPVNDVKLILRQDWLDEIGQTNDQGKAIVPIRRDTESWNLFAYKPGYGFGHLKFDSGDDSSTPRSKRYSADAIQKAMNEWIQKNPQPVKIQLTDTRPVHVHVVDQNNQPVPGVVVSSPYYMAPPDFDRVTDRNGIAIFDFLQIQNTSQIGRVDFNISFNRYPEADQHSRFYPLEPFKWDPDSKNDNLTFRVAKMVPIRGRMLDDKGNPIARAHIRAFNSHFEGHGISKDDGSYEIYLRPGDGYTVIASTDKGASAPTKHFRLDYETPIDGLDLTINPRAEVTFIGAEEINSLGTKRSRRECNILSYDSLPSSPFDPLAKNAAWNLAHIHPQSMGSPGGNGNRLIFTLGPGAYMYFGRPWQDPVIFRVTDSSPRSITVQDPPDFPGESLLTGAVLDENDKPRPHVEMHLFPLNSPATGDIYAQTNDAGRFSIKRPKIPAVLRARADRGESIQLIDADTTTIELRPNTLATVRGQFGILPPLKIGTRWQIRLAIPVFDASSELWPISFGDIIQENREFSIQRVPTGIEFDLQISDDRKTWLTISKFKADTAGDHELGVIELNPDVIDAALDNPLARAFRMGRNHTAMDRLSGLFYDATRSNLPVVIVAGDPTGPLCRELSDMLKEDRSFLDKCHLIGLRVSAPFHQDAQSFLPWLDVDVQDAKRLVIAVAAPDGTLLNRWKPDDFAEGDHLDRAKLKALLTNHLTR